MLATIGLIIVNIIGNSIPALSNRQDEVCRKPVIFLVFIIIIMSMSEILRLYSACKQLCTFLDHEGVDACGTSKDYNH